MSGMCKRIFRFELEVSGYWNFPYSQKSKFLKYNWNDTDHLLLPYESYGTDMWRIFFFIIGSCEPLMNEKAALTKSQKLY